LAVAIVAVVAKFLVRVFASIRASSPSLSLLDSQAVQWQMVTALLTCAADIRFPRLPPNSIGSGMNWSPKSYSLATEKYFAADEKFRGWSFVANSHCCRPFTSQSPAPHQTLQISGFFLGAFRVTRKKRAEPG
jgi:hypothetical protein